jgi:hypothetical protein
MNGHKECVPVPDVIQTNAMIVPMNTTVIGHQSKAHPTATIHALTQMDHQIVS